MKEKIFADIRIALLSLLAIGLLLLLILELIPSSSPLLSEEPFTVYASDLGGGKGYLCTVSGKLVNQSETNLDVESIEITLKKGDSAKDVVIESHMILPPRMGQNFGTTFESDVAFDTVEKATVQTSSGKVISVSNMAASPSVGFIPLLFLFLEAVVIFFLVRSFKFRYYLYQEDKMRG